MPDHQLSNSHLPRTIRLGVMGCSSFAMRAMLPAIAEASGVELVGIASRDIEKATAATKVFGGRAHANYAALLSDGDVDAVYMPLPTGLHDEWVHKALDAGKHLLAEKSLAGSLASASRMIQSARQKGLLVLENFLFPRHSQFAWVKEQLAAGAIGQVRFIRAAFTIPPLPADNFRYNRELGGGALLDVGAYMVKSVTALLGHDIELLAATVDSSQSSVDLSGSATFRAPSGVVAQTLWSFDTAYQCTWEFIGSEGRIFCERSLTPPPGFEPPVRVERGNERRSINLPADNHYANQWNFFAQAAHDPDSIPALLDEALTQARLIEAVRNFHDRRCNSRQRANA